MTAPEDRGISTRTGNTDWMRAAACVGYDPELFHPVSRKREHALVALAVCSQCAVRTECREYADATGDTWAVLGGTTPDDRADVRLKRGRQSIRYHIGKGRSDAEIAALVGVAPADVADIRADRFTADRSATRQPCGTPAAYRRHLRNGKTPCGPCRLAANRERDDNRRRKAAAA